MQAGTATEGIAAYESHDWREARRVLLPLLEVGDAPPDAHEALGESAWWLGDTPTAIEALQRAYVGFSGTGDHRGAARCAIRLAELNFLRLQTSVASGWLNRAERLLDGEPAVPETGSLLRIRAALAEGRLGGLDEAIDLVRRVHQIGVDLGDADLQMLGLHDHGRFLVAKGEVQAGFAMMEEAMISAVAGQLTPMTTGRIFCNMIEVCSRTADLERGIEWSDQALEWCREMGDQGGYPGVCRVRRAEFMRLRGSWTEAQSEAERAVDDLSDLLPYMGGAFNEIGMIRLNLGDLAQAESAFRRAHTLGATAQPGLALLQMAKGRVEEAADMIEAALDATEELHTRSTLLPAAVEIAAAVPDLEGARGHASELGELAERYDSDILRAFSKQSNGRVAVLEGDPEGAASLFERAMSLFLVKGLPFEAARARADYGSALAATGSEGAGRLEIEAARSELERLGARLELDRLPRIDGPGAPEQKSSDEAALMFTDIVRSTDLIGVIGDEPWADLVGWHDRTIRRLVDEWDGTEVDHAGDGFFVSFASADEALRCAAAIQRVLRDHRKDAGFSPSVRIGVHVGRVVETEGGLVGHEVHVAARVASAAAGGEILASREVVDRVAAFEFEELRPITAKGVDRPVEVARLVWQGAA